MGAFAVTVDGAKKRVEKFAAENDEYNKIMVQILATVLWKHLQNVYMKK